MKKQIVIGVLLGVGFIGYLFLPRAPLANGEVCLNGQYTGEVGLAVQITEHEISEDANWTFEELYVNDDRYYYAWEYSGYHPNKNYVRERSKHGRLREEEREALIVLAEQAELQSALKSEGEVVEGDYLAVRFEYFDGEDCVEVIVEGMESAYFDDTVELIGHEDVVQAVKRIMWYAKGDVLDR